MAKVNGKWIVEHGLGDKHVDLADLLRDGVALDVSQVRVPWESCVRVSCRESVQGRNGVLGLELELPSEGKRVVLVKSTVSAAQEAFSATLSEALGVRCPRFRVLDSSSDEYEDLKSAVSDILQKDEYQHAKIMYSYLDLRQFLVIEAAVQCRPLSQLQSTQLSLDTLFQLGVMIIFDMLIANGDRLPLAGVWDRPGNAENVLFRVENNTASTLVAIDQVAAHPTDADIRVKYLQSIANVLSSEKALIDALGSTMAFLERHLAHPLPAGALQIILGGIRQGVCRASEISLEDLLAVVDQVRGMVGQSEAVWDESLSHVDVEFMNDIVRTLQQSGLHQVRFEREEGTRGLARVCSLMQRETSIVEIFFDFDRTLTNGLATGSDLPVEKRVRGGRESIEALRSMREAGVSMHVVTARSPRKVVVEQLVSSLRGPQREIGSFFLSNEQFEGQEQPETHETIFCGHQLAYASDAPLYASDYQKPAAVAHALCRRYSADEKTQEAITVVFVDDVAMNAHDVGTRLAQMLSDAGRPDLARRVTIRAVWWDTFSEDTGVSPCMLPEFGKTEQGYQDFMLPQLLDFGISRAEALRRRQVYAAEEVASGRPKRVSEVREIRKLKPATAAQEKLASFLFGGGKKKE